MVGIIEFNSTLLRKSGADPDAFLEELAARFARIVVLQGNKFRDFPNPTPAGLRALCGSQEVEVDLILLTPATLVEQFSIRLRA